MSDKKPKGIEEAKPIYIESLLDTRDYKNMRHQYPNTYHSEYPRNVGDFVPGHMKWRYQMGALFTPEGVKLTNKQADELHQKLREYHGKYTGEDTSKTL